MTIKLIYFLVFGLCIGSFLNVCIYRMPRKLSVSFPRRSFCPGCQTMISWSDNIPVLSWLFLRGKCRSCGIKISPVYPLVEFLSGLAAVLCAIRFEHLPTAILVYVLVAALITITFIDLEHKIIPNLISYPGMILGLLLGIEQQYLHFFTWPINNGAMDALLGFLVGGGFFYVIGLGYYLVTKRVGLGGGDIKLMAMTGAILGWESVPTTIFVGSLVGSVVGVGWMLIKGGGRHLEIPFGPWLSLGCIAYLLSGFNWLSFYGY